MMMRAIEDSHHSNSTESLRELQGTWEDEQAGEVVEDANIAESLTTPGPATGEIPYSLGYDDMGYYVPVDAYRNTYPPPPNPPAPSFRSWSGPSEASSAFVTCTFGIMTDEGKLAFKSHNIFSQAHYPGTLTFEHVLETELNHSSGLVFLIITNWQSWFIEGLQSSIPNFPVHPVLHLSNNRATTMLPLLDHSQCEISCVMEHIDISDKFDSNQNALNIGSTKAVSKPLVVWARGRNAIPAQPNRSVAMVISVSSGEDVISRLSGHYTQESGGMVKYDRWMRLQANQVWIYHDLSFLFTHWENVWGAVKADLNVRTQEVLGSRRKISILDQTRQLHKDNNVMISLQEHLRIHKASLQIVVQRTKNASETLEWTQSNVLNTRLEDSFQLLEYYDVTATSLLERQQNLVSLAFNSETVVQSQAVARLNALAFVFLPLSFVASVFGITTFTVQPQWYPAVAIPTLIATVAIAWLANWIFMSGDKQESSIPHSFDVEKYSIKGAKPATSEPWTSRTWKKWKANQRRVSKLFTPPKPQPQPQPFLPLSPAISAYGVGQAGAEPQHTTQNSAMQMITGVQASIRQTHSQFHVLPRANAQLEGRQQSGEMMVPSAYALPPQQSRPPPAAPIIRPRQNPGSPYNVIPLANPQTQVQAQIQTKVQTQATVKTNAGQSTYYELSAQTYTTRNTAARTATPAPAAGEASRAISRGYVPYAPLSATSGPFSAPYPVEEGEFAIFDPGDGSLGGLGGTPIAAISALPEQSEIVVPAEGASIAVEPRLGWVMGGDEESRATLETILERGEEVIDL